jgi:hypothetical protein
MRQSFRFEGHRKFQLANVRDAEVERWSGAWAGTGVAGKRTVFDEENQKQPSFGRSSVSNWSGNLETEIKCSETDETV